MNMTRGLLAASLAGFTMLTSHELDVVRVSRDREHSHSRGTPRLA